MRTRRTSRATGIAAIAVSLRWLVARYALPLLFLVAALCVAISQNKPETLSAIRARLTQSLIPAWQVLAAPSDFIARTSDSISDIRHTYDDNLRLKADNAALRQWQAEAERLRAENARLQQIAQYTGPAATRLLTAKVASDISSSYQHSLLALAGSQDSITVGTVAMGPDGVIGRVIETGPKAARILLLTDVNARIPARLEESDATAIVAGDGSDTPHLIYLPRDVTPVVGERVVTSGHGGIFPSGLLIGTVTAVKGEEVEVTPAENADNLDIVRLVDYRPPTDVTPAHPVSSPKKK